jgi:glycerol-3-phosphate acyltransferase PlsY
MQLRPPLQCVPHGCANDAAGRTAVIFQAMLELGTKITLAYLLGAVMGALLVGQLRGGVDIRKAGSGNAGGTNALRTQGKAFAAWVLLVDIGKGVLAAAVIPNLEIPGIGIDPAIGREPLLYAVAFAAIAGHAFPVWYEFRGGKGGATAAGLLCFLVPMLAWPILLMWLIVVFFSGFVGLATISSAVAAAVYIGVTEFNERLPLFVFAAAVAALIIYTHRGNLQRMLNGTESRFGRFFGLR